MKSEDEVSLVALHVYSSSGYCSCHRFLVTQGCPCDGGLQCHRHRDWQSHD